LINIAIFASGSGSNAENIVKYFRNHRNIRVALILSNREDAYVLERAKNLDIPAVYLSKNDFRNPDVILPKLSSSKIDFIVLAGFLLLIPYFLIEAYPDRIVNIHPALLPKFGGKGMFGSNVHRAVLEAGEKESGISIHYVNENYDEGRIIFQSAFEITPEMSLEKLESKIHEEEYRHYPPVIEKTINLIFG
jgi:phosphoribosylglycinamide formyltransferase-1